VLLVSTAIAAPLLVLGLANAARLSLPEPQQPPEPAYLSMPELPATQLRLADQLPPLPVVDTTDARDRPFVAAYLESPATDAPAMLGLLEAALDELNVVDGDANDIAAFALSLAYQEPARAAEGESVEYFDPDFESDAWRRLAASAMSALEGDAANARALNDVAVGLVATSFATEQSERPATGRPIMPPDSLLASARRLLELGLTSFPNDRAMTSNLAFVQSLSPHFDQDPEPVLGLLEDHLERDPDDVTAMALLANLEVRIDPTAGLDRALAALDPAIANPATEAAGRVGRGDALMASVDARRNESPFLTRALTEQALAEYDAAAQLSGDPGALTGRSVALERLGWLDAAAVAQAEALRRAESSPAWQLRLAQLDGCRGQVEGWRPESNRALELATAEASPPLARTRLLLRDAPGRGYLAYSVGSDAASLERFGGETGGGASLATVDPFPAPDCSNPESTSGGIGARAATEAILAALEVDDFDGAHAAIDAWAQLPPPYGDEFDEQVSRPEQWSNLVDLLDGGQFDQERDTLELFLADAWRLSSTAQTRLCRRVVEATAGQSLFEDPLALCLAEAATRAGDYAAAAKAIDPRVMLTNDETPTRGRLAIQAGMLSEQAGDLDAARARYERGATDQETAILGLTRLGDLELREGDAAGALDHYDLALAAISTQLHGTQDFYIDEPPIRPIRHYLHNNRGIALLATARPSSKGAPDCSEHADICSEAASEFEIALESDTANPIYLMNAAWAARLSGSPDRAVELLRQSLEQGNPLEASVRNDLGVLAARAGDSERANEEFRSALAMSPGHPLATWNLGILLAGRPGSDALGGQALIADAVEITPAFRTDPLAFKLDETIYRVEVSRPDRLVLEDAPGGAIAAGGAVFGTIALVGAAGRFLGSLSKPTEQVATTVVKERLAGRRKGLRSAVRLRAVARRIGVRWRSWFVWIPTLAVLVGSTAWSAAWAAPDAVIGAVVVTLAAMSLALVAHGAGHAVAGAAMRTRLLPARWDAGFAVAIAGLPFHVVSGPFLPERIVAGNPGKGWWVSLAGIVASVAAAGVTAALYAVEPLPFLRIATATHLAVAGYALIPSKPLDGDRLATRPVVLALIGLGVASASTLLLVGQG
jgi:tetratricopeptide (TPR) repeat protein